MLKALLFSLSLFFSTSSVFGSIEIIGSDSSYFISLTEDEVKEFSSNEASPKKFKKLFSKSNKTIAAVLAFPIIGCTGLHRVYLGSKAWVPVVYIATLGGCLGILPFIDFVVILFSKDMEKFEDNPKVFMWMGK